MVHLDDFNLLSKLGKGCYGTVFLVTFIPTNQIFAMKVVKKSLIAAKDEIRHTQSQRKILQRLRHPFIVKLRFAFQTSTKLYFILEYCPGGELFFHLSRSARFGVQRTRFYSACILLALEYLHHQNIIYREQYISSLKPENVLIDSDGYAKLTDFGLSKENIMDNTSAITFCGTPEYLAPQVILRQGHGKAVDMWSFGCLIYQMLVGYPPYFTSRRDMLYVRIVNEKIKFPMYFDQDARDLIENLVVKNPDLRLTCEEVKEHPWFCGVDWQVLERKGVQPQFVPDLEMRYVSEVEEKREESDCEAVEEAVFTLDGFNYSGSPLLK